MTGTRFDLWLEFEHWGRREGSDPEDDFFNMSIRMPGGEKYALNVWTYKFLERARGEDKSSAENLSGKYMVAPDLFVERLDRQLVTEVVEDLIARQGLKKEWLVIED